MRVDSSGSLFRDASLRNPHSKSLVPSSPTLVAWLKLQILRNHPIGGCVAAERFYITEYYHPSNWRKRLDFGTRFSAIWFAIPLILLLLPILNQLTVWTMAPTLIIESLIIMFDILTREPISPLIRLHAINSMGTWGRLKKLTLLGDRKITYQGSI